MSLKIKEDGPLTLDVAFDAIDRFISHQGKESRGKLLFKSIMILVSEKVKFRPLYYTYHQVFQRNVLKVCLFSEGKGFIWKYSGWNAVNGESFITVHLWF